ncbi:unnamed protein product [Prorocentrum cordatum]|uniref:Transmembrane protein 107 n=1 Tax=Prorocentrum cordatum TaxID=2364126 RepID=A0ABN9US49_9DINO|nr:unnamed protein product [Polarella glacialis]
MLDRAALGQKKRLDLLLACHASLAAVSGSLATLFPHVFGFFFGEQWHGSFRFNPDDGQVKITHVVIRLYGSLILGQAFVAWAVRQSADGHLRRGIVRAYCLVFTLTMLVLLRSHFTDEHWHWFNLANIILFAGLAAFYGWFCYFSPPPVFEGLDKAVS